MKKMHKIILFFLLIFISNISFINAQNNDNSTRKIDNNANLNTSNIYIRADKTIYDPNNNNFSFEGNVFIKRSNMNMLTSNVYVKMGENNQILNIEFPYETKSVVGENVIIAKKALYENSKKTMTFYDEVEIFDQNVLLKTTRAVYNFDNGEFVAFEEGESVNVLINLN